MTLTDKRWQLASPITPEADNNLKDYAPTLRQVLFNRGIGTAAEAETFLNAPLPHTDPFLLLEMGTAVARIRRAITDGERIVIYGDYDVDGVTASVLMVETLRALNANVDNYIPNRFDEGYGLNKDALTELKQTGAGLVITVDCGIRSIPEAEHARSIGLDMIITDHHSPAADLPPALAVINPKRDGDPYPEKLLAGVGVAYKLACALLKVAGEPLDPESLLDLVAIGTVADLVPLTGENRPLVRHGLALLRATRRQGVLSLLGVAGVPPATLNAGHIGFIIGPRLNAAGRLADAQEAFNLLTCTDVFKAGALAQALDDRNRERQEVTRAVQTRADELAGAGDPDKLILFALDASFNLGVVGLAAARLVEAHYRPAVVAGQEGEFTRASCRSIPEFHITAALDECADLIDHHGGHAAAAGFTVLTSRYPELVKRLEAIARRELGGKDLRPLLNADAEVPLVDLQASLLKDLDKLQPTGYGNREPAFISRGVLAKSVKAVGKEGAHLKLVVSDGWVMMDAIAFRQGHWAGKIPPKLDILYNFEMNEFNGRQRLQLNVKDIKASEGGL
ncbi:MAG: single-stranded-DNA-specific exonuclease RecJ [Anaerolineae bacterium]|nr:MAG: single-stranded-DNA-specific exonuclease RecJ [Anaerolineae bacterium]